MTKASVTKKGVLIKIEDTAEHYNLLRDIAKQFTLHRKFDLVFEESFQGFKSNWRFVLSAGNVSSTSCCSSAAINRSAKD